MSEIVTIIFYNVLILSFIAISVYVYLKWQHKKRIDRMLDEMEKSYSKFADHKANERMQKGLMSTIKDTHSKHLNGNLKIKLNGFYRLPPYA